MGYYTLNQIVANISKILPDDIGNEMSLKSQVNQYASQCVKCALCLPYCPTYTLTEDENESPRGRIALFQALSQSHLPANKKIQTHLDQCLGCRACERVCPAHVEYGLLLTKGRALLQQLPAQEPLRKPSLATRFLSWTAKKPQIQKGMHWVLWILQVLGLRRLARQLKLTQLLGLAPLDNLLPQLQKPLSLPPYLKAIGPKKGTVMLFKGCTSWCDQETLAASVTVLRHFGYDVIIPKEQNCCGALALHAGKIEEAYLLAQQNQKAFNQPIDHIITFATGCSAVLQEYDQHFSSYSDLTEADLKYFSHKVIDILTFVAACEWPKNLSLQPLPLKVVLHTPCTRLNVLKTPLVVDQIFARIPQLEWKRFQSTNCCGAAGTYMLDHPAIADPLAKELLAEIDDIQVDYVATSNIGCGLHIQQQLNTLNPTIKICHPISLLAKALGVCYLNIGTIKGT